MTAPYALLVIGGGPAGLAAARAYREQGGGGRVAIVGDEHRMPYHRPPLTKELLRGEASEGDLPIESAAWLARQRIDLVAGRVVTLDADERVAELVRRTRAAIPAVSARDRCRADPAAGPRCRSSGGSRGQNA